ncbi:inner membrane protein OXA1-like [Euphorbia peplus]|nr:inner membrane protein OXA1-like [Euphorbia peplus]
MLMMPHFKEIQQKVRDGGLHMDDGWKQMQMLVKEYNVTPFTRTRGLFIRIPVFICFLLALSNMEEKVPSFKSGGVYWFLDLSTPATLYVFPLLTALTFWMIVEVKIKQNPKGTRIVQNSLRGFAVLYFPLIMGLPKAILCYLITFHISGLAFYLGVKLSKVKKFLGSSETSQKIRSQVKTSKENK